MALIERTCIPDDRQLRVLASATPEEQTKALKSIPKAELRDSRNISWWKVIDAVVVKAVSRAHALFDPEKSGLAWEEDLFAEPNDPAAFFTRDVKGFVKLQLAALEADAQAMRARKRKMEIVEPNEAGGPILPKGWTQCWGADPKKPSASQTVFAAMDGNGRIRRCVADPAVPAPKKGAAAASRGGDDTAGEDARAEPVARGPISKKGLEAIAAIKTKALREALRGDLSALPAETLAALLLLTFNARNVRLHIRRVRPSVTDDLAIIPRDLLLPGGILAPIDPEKLGSLAGAAMAAILGVGGPDSEKSSYSNASGDAAEWIGAAVRADDRLPRFDTEEFLAFVQTGELKRLEKEAGIKASGSGAEIRAALVGKLPDWRPCAFGAPVPSEAGDRGEDDEDSGGGEEGEDLEDAA